MAAMSEPGLSSDDVPAAPSDTLAAALALKFPQLQALLAAHPGQAGGDLLPYLLLAELYRWLTERAAAAGADDAEAQAVVQLCGELFAMTLEHDPLGAAFASEIIESMLDATRGRAPTES
jgi:hypothetical protein